MAGLHDLNRAAIPDVILLARGGGSIEDLWAFNDEGVARAIAASQAPVITGVGHETDFTIADFVADLRAPTPTAAAEMATPNREDLLIDLNGAKQRLAQMVASQLSDQRWQLNELQARLKRLSPETRIQSDRQRLDELSYRTARSLSHFLEIQRAHLTATEQRLTDLNPQTILARGYAIVSQANVDGNNVRSVKQVKEGDSLNVRVSDGEFGVEVRNG